MYFHHYIQEYLDTVPGYSQGELFKKLKEYYNGYSWDGKHFVYNPISIMSFFLHKEFKSFWFATGTPTFLAKMARTRGGDVRAWEELEVSHQFFDKFDIANIDTDLLLFQTGYLTIKKYDGETDTYIYIIEFKMGSVAKALKQINDKAYYEQFLAQQKKIILLGIGFNAEKRNIADFDQKEITPGTKAKEPK